MKKSFLHMLLLLIGLWVATQSQSAPSNFKEGKCRAYGVNFFDVFTRLLGESSRDPVDAFSELARYRVAFVRFAAGGYWPSDWQLYVRDPEAHFARLDSVVDAAERAGIGLIPSLFWNYAAIPDLVGEPMTAWRDPRSKTIAFMREYTERLVARYRHSRAIWVWEFGNEMNLYVDLPNGDKWLPKVRRDKGTPASRSFKDEISLVDLSNATEIFEATVRAQGATQPLSTGGGMPRPYAFHNWKRKTWDLDDPGQFSEILQRQNPMGFQLFSVHLYPHHESKYPKLGENYDAILDRVSRAAEATGGVVFIGEFGVSGNGNRAKAEFDRIVSAISRSRVALAALWVYRFDWQRATYDVRPGGPREYQLARLRDENAVFAEKGTLCGFN